VTDPAFSADCQVEAPLFAEGAVFSDEMLFELVNRFERFSARQLFDRERCRAVLADRGVKARTFCSSCQRISNMIPKSVFDAAKCKADIGLAGNAADDAIDYPHSIAGRRHVSPFRARGIDRRRRAPSR